MPRQARARNNSGIHHVVVQGARNKNIFKKASDKERYLDTLLEYKAKFDIELYAYCILENHAHILLREGEIDVSSLMRRIGVSFSYWYKKQYEETGAVFRGRYLSEALREEELGSAIQYIHEEPVRMGLVKKAEEYPWSHAKRNCSFLWEVAEGDKERREEFLEQVPGKFGKERREAEAAVRKRMKGRAVAELRGMDKEERNTILRTLRYEDEISIQLLSQVTGVGRGIIQRLKP